MNSLILNMGAVEIAPREAPSGGGSHGVAIVDGRAREKTLEKGKLEFLLALECICYLICML